MPFQIVHNDITKMNTDMIVNAANSALRPGGGVCGAIFRAAGFDGLVEECRKKAPCPTGSAVITGAGDLPVKYIAHAVGPVWRDGTHGERELLAGAYRSSLELALEYKCRSIAFPLISAGIYGYPQDQALAVAVSVISEFLLQHELEVYLVVFDRGAVQLSQQLFADVRHYVDSYYTPEPGERRREKERWSFQRDWDACVQENTAAAFDAEPTAFAKKEKSTAKIRRTEELYPGSVSPRASFGASVKGAISPKARRSLQDLLAHSGETFSEMLLRLIDEKGYTDVEVYKRANMDRKLFSKIRSNRDYHPKKSTVHALAIALRLSLDEATDLLCAAGYSFSDSHKQDIIIRYFLERGEYDIFTINETLFCFEEPLLGA